MKKPWEKPKLMVLVRGRPEEMVLQACKTSQLGTNGPGGTDNDGCFVTGPYGGTNQCDAIVST
jgi:hypothetical protein